MCSSKQETDTGSLRELEAGLRQAVAAKEVDAALTYFSDDVIILLPNERLEGKAALKESMFRAVLSEGFAIATTVTMEEKTDRLGYTVVDYDVTTLGQDGSPIRTSGNLVRVWKKQGTGSWQVVVEIVNQSTD
jgi:ketosteroid isomerase-like protein